MAKKQESLGQCTAIRTTGNRCTNQATRPGVPDVYGQPLCETCRKRLHRQNTADCSESGCPNRVKNSLSRKERFVPQPWCRIHEHRALAADTIGVEERERIKQELIANIQSNWETGCWEWVKVKSGYGHYKGRTKVGEWKAHRLSWHLFHEGHSRNEVLDHLCINSRCVNPLHLTPTTQKLNVKLRDQRKKDPDYVWHGNQSQQINTELLDFASENKLVFVTHDNDYSKSWNPVNVVAKVLDATHIESVELSEVRVPMDPAFVTASPEQLETLKPDIREKTLGDLALSKYEADYLAGFKFLSRRIKRSRRTSADRKKTLSRRPLWMD